MKWFTTMFDAALKATDAVIACHDKDGDDYHDATLVPTKLT